MHKGKNLSKPVRMLSFNGIISGFISGDEPGEGAMHIEITQ